MTYTKNVVDASIRTAIFNELNVENIEGFKKINDRQYGIIVTDLNGHKRYVRVGAIVAEEREDMSAEELMESEVAKYNEAQEKKAEKKRKSEEKAKHDKAMREKKAKEKAEKEKEDEGQDDPNQYLDREVTY